jgi:glycosyltransferase involved in cell wall biosynthesis
MKRPRSIPLLQPPLFPEVGVIALVADEWSEEWMSRHQILTRLAKYFHVIWVSPARAWRQVLDGGKPSSYQTQDHPAGFHVYESEFWLPKFYRPRWLANLSFFARLRQARKRLVRQGCRKIVLYIWRPEFSESIDAIPFDLSCYHIVDEYSFSDDDLPISEEERRLVERVDHVFVHTAALLEKKGQLNRHVTLVPNGVDYRAFSDGVPEPSRLATISHPRIGYAGYLKRTLDWNLLRQLAHRHPDYSFVFVGAQKNQVEVTRGVEELSRLPNVHFLGGMTTSELANYPQHFDVCIMPYKLNDYAKYGYPLKLHEYLAAGRPSVGARMRVLEEFEDTVYLCNSVDDWSDAISKALGPEANTKEAREARQRVAKQHDWDLLAKRIAGVLSERLDTNNAKPLDDALTLN